MSGSDLCIPRNETAWPRYFQNIIIIFCLPISTFMYLWAIYIFPGLVCLICCIQIGRLINRSKIHEGRKWEWEVQFHFWEYINQIFDIVDNMHVMVFFKNLFCRRYKPCGVYVQIASTLFSVYHRGFLLLYILFLIAGYIHLQCEAKKVKFFIITVHSIIITQVSILKAERSY